MDTDSVPVWKLAVQIWVFWAALEPGRGDAHELNPVELVCSHLRRSLTNLSKRNLPQLTALVKTRLKRMQYRPGTCAVIISVTYGFSSERVPASSG